MANNGWSICDFMFKYKGIEYIVLVKRFTNGEKRTHEYALVKLHFMRSENIHHDLEVEANRNGLLIDAKKLREYFQIEYTANLGNIFRQFARQLGKAIPPKMSPLTLLSSAEKRAMVYSLSISDSEDPNKIYCTGVKRNPSGKTRSPFNSDKTKILRPTLYKIFSNDCSISFCYTADVNKRKDDATICKNFANK